MRAERFFISGVILRFVRTSLIILASLLPSFGTAAVVVQDGDCMAGELPAYEMPLEFVRPKIPLECWRAPRESDGRGISFKAHFDVSPAGEPRNIVIDYADPSCAAEYLPKMIEELRYACSELGRKGMKMRMTISD